MFIFFRVSAILSLLFRDYDGSNAEISEAQNQLLNMVNVTIKVLLI